MSGGVMAKPTTCVTTRWDDRTLDLRVTELPRSMVCAAHARDQAGGKPGISCHASFFATPLPRVIHPSEDWKVDIMQRGAVGRGRYILESGGQSKKCRAAMRLIVTSPPRPGVESGRSAPRALWCFFLAPTSSRVIAGRPVSASTSSIPALSVRSQKTCDCAPRAPNSAVACA